LTAIELPGLTHELSTDAENAPEIPWNVILYNDDVHSFEEVIFQVQKATGFALERAVEITLEAHQTGRAVCFTGDLDTCNRVAGILKEIRLHVEIDRSGPG